MGPKLEKRGTVLPFELPLYSNLVEGFLFFRVNYDTNLEPSCFTSTDTPLLPRPI